MRHLTLSITTCIREHGGGTFLLKAFKHFDCNATIMIRQHKNSVIINRRRFAGRPKRVTFWIPFVGFSVLLIVYVYSYGEIYSLFGRPPEQSIKKNYFQSALELAKGNFLVKNEKCQIPDISLWSPELKFLLDQRPPFKCNKINLTYVNNDVLIINTDKIKELGYENDDVKCCYHTVSRVEQSNESFDKNADNHYRFSDICHPMKNETRPVHGFIQVVCSTTYLFVDVTVYRNLHLIAKFPGDDSALNEKLSHWERCFDLAENSTTPQNCPRERPPNILLIGMDSTSRLNFHRFMNKSIEVLEKHVEATEMNGYTKVGENTFPNFVPLMSSYSEEELVEICYTTRWTPQDKCPYIWKKFSDLHYLTAHLEDDPEYAIFNYLKTGFIKKPVDMYIRPWMFAAYDNKDSKSHDCLGYQRPEEIILKYMVDLVALSESRKIPYFITSWLTDLTHDDMSNIQRMDSLLENTLETLHTNGYLNNTLLLVMSDHGYRFGDVRSTTSGWFEDKLPVMYVKLPDNLAKEHPSWVEGVKYNSKQLLTTFDVHATIKDILKLAYLKTGQNITSLDDDGISSYNFTTPPLRGQSLFKNLPLRSCEDAGVPKAYCACSPPTAFTGNESLIELGALAIINSINAKLPSVCKPLKVGKITASAVVTESHKDILTNATTTDYVISLETKPGKFAYEAVVTFNQTGGQFTNVVNILRTNKKNRETLCLSDKEAASELFCYC